MTLEPSEEQRCKSDKKLAILPVIVVFPTNAHGSQWKAIAVHNSASLCLLLALVIRLTLKMRW